MATSNYWSTRIIRYLIENYNNNITWATILRAKGVAIIDWEKIVLINYLWYRSLSKWQQSIIFARRETQCVIFYIRKQRENWLLEVKFHVDWFWFRDRQTIDGFICRFQERPRSFCTRVQHPGSVDCARRWRRCDAPTWSLAPVLSLSLSLAPLPVDFSTWHQREGYTSGWSVFPAKRRRPSLVVVHSRARIRELSPRKSNDIASRWTVPSPRPHIEIFCSAIALSFEFAVLERYFEVI